MSGALIAAVVLLLWLLVRSSRPSRPSAPIQRAVVCLVAGEQLLVLRRVQKSGVSERLELPKGRVGRGEAPLDAAYRECLEESGLRPPALHPLTTLEPWRGKQGRREIWTVFWGELPTVTALPAEHRVTGQGRDRGRRYRLGLLPLDQVKFGEPLEHLVPVLRQHVLTQPPVEAR